MTELAPDTECLSRFEETILVKLWRGTEETAATLMYGWMDRKGFPKGFSYNEGEGKEKAEVEGGEIAAQHWLSRVG